MFFLKKNKIYSINDDDDDLLSNSTIEKSSILYGLYIRETHDSLEHILSISFNINLLELIKNNYLEENEKFHSWICEVNMFEITKKNFFVRLYNYFSFDSSFYSYYFIKKIEYINPTLNIKFFCYKSYSTTWSDELISKENIIDENSCKITYNIIVVNTKNIRLSLFNKIKKKYDKNNKFFSKHEIKIDYWYPLSIWLDIHSKIEI
jgi:hypothetical protein